MKVTANSAIFVMIDIQEKFLPHIKDIDEVVKNVNILNKFSELMEIPLLITEQNPEGLGKTLNSIYIPNNHKLMTKTRFSIFAPDIEIYLNRFEKKELSILDHHSDKPNKDIVLYGIEAHICVMQSVLEAISKRYRPVVVADAVSSISAANKEIAMQRIRQVGGTVVSTEMLLFEILQGSYHPNFKTVSKLIKESKK